MDILKQLLKYENDLYLKKKLEGKKIIKPSVLLMYIFLFFYVCSGIDIIPESFIRPKAFGYIDDLILTIVIVIYTYDSIGGVLDGIPEIRIPKREKLDKQDKLCIKNETREISDNNEPTNIRRDTVNSNESCDRIVSKPDIASDIFDSNNAVADRIFDEDGYSDGIGDQQRKDGGKDLPFEW